MTDFSLPGTELTGTDPVMRAIVERGKASDARIARTQQEFEASRQREEQARTAQSKAVAPVIDKERGLLDKGAPRAPAEAPTPTPPQAPHLDGDAMWNLMSTVAMLAAAGGALSREPLTAAMNNFAAGIEGFKQGQTDTYTKEMKSFEANLRKAKEQNDAAYRKYKAAVDKYKTDIEGLQQQVKLIAAEYQNPIDLELANRGDLVSWEKLQETREANWNRVMEQWSAVKARIDAQKQSHVDAKEAQRQAHEDAGWQTFVGKDGKLQRVNARTGEVKAFEGDTGGLGKPGVKPDTDKQRQGLMAEQDRAARKIYAEYLRAWNKAAGDTDKQAQLTAQVKNQLAALSDSMKNRGLEGHPLGFQVPDKPHVFKSEAEMDAANLPDGTPVIVNGVSGTYRKAK